MIVNAGTAAIKMKQRIAELEAGLKKCMELSNINSSDTYELDSALDEIWRPVDEALKESKS